LPFAFFNAMSNPRQDKTERTAFSCLWVEDDPAFASMVTQVVREEGGLVANFVPMPSLRFTLPQPGLLVFTWPAHDPAVMLEANGELTGAGWLPVTHEVSVVGTNRQVRISPLTGRRYFRLVKP